MLCVKFNTKTKGFHLGPLENAFFPAMSTSLCTVSDFFPLRVSYYPKKKKFSRGFKVQEMQLHTVAMARDVEDPDLASLTVEAGIYGHSDLYHAVQNFSSSLRIVLEISFSSLSWAKKRTFSCFVTRHWNWVHSAVACINTAVRSWFK